MGFRNSLRALLAVSCLIPLAGIPAAGAGTVPSSPIADVVARVTPSVVRVVVVHPPEQPLEAAAANAKSGRARAAQAGPVTKIGSGFAIDGNGLIATNRHVIENSISIFVSTKDGSRYRADVVGIASRADIALLRVDPAAKVPPLAWGDSDTLRPGDVVVAIGSPFGFDNTVTAGIVSSTNRDIMESPFDDYIQTDAAINHGNSGGPLFNLAGEVVGMNSVLFGPTQGSAGLGFAIPSKDLRFVLDRLEKYGEVRGGMLPVRTQQVTGLMAAALGIPHAGGALITSLYPEAGVMGGKIEPGDVIATINGERVWDPRDLARKAAMLDVGSQATLHVYRDGKPIEVTVPVVPLEGLQPLAGNDGFRPRVLGLRLASADGAAVRLADIDPAGSAADSGLQKGDVILRVQQQSVSSAEQAMKAIKARADAKAPYAALLIRRDGKEWWVPVALPG